MRRRSGYLWLASGTLVVDQLSKWVVEELLDGGSVSVLGEIVRLTCVHNPGGAFGIFPDHGTLFIVVSAVVAAVLGLGFLRGWFVGWRATGAALLWAGTVGNLLDRLHRGYVLDFIAVWRWPVFNVADVCIVVGGFLLVVGLIKPARRKE